MAVLRFPRSFVHQVAPIAVFLHNLCTIMTLTVNHQSVEIADSASLGALLTQLAIANRKGIAVAVNNAIVPRAAWDQFVLSGNEKITILQATQGG
ncbi:sulfur carrier protein ThiS [Spirosoma pulveris]